MPQKDARAGLATGRQGGRAHARGCVPVARPTWGGLAPRGVHWAVRLGNWAPSEVSWPQGKGLVTDPEHRAESTLPVGAPEPQVLPLFQGQQGQFRKRPSCRNPVLKTVVQRTVSTTWGPCPGVSSAWMARPSQGSAAQCLTSALLLDDIPPTPGPGLPTCQGAGRALPLWLGALPPWARRVACGCRGRCPE